MAAISTFALVATGISAAVSAVGAIAQGQQQASIARYNQGLARQNAAIVEQQAAEDAERSRRETRRRISAIEAAYGASGIDLSGSALDVIDDAEIEGELDALTIKYRGILESRRYLSGATEQGFRAQSAELAGYAGAASAILSGVGRIGGPLDFGGSSSAGGHIAGPGHSSSFKPFSHFGGPR